MTGKTFLEENDRAWYENDILQGLVTAGAKMTPEERLRRVRAFLPRIETGQSVIFSAAP